MHNSDAHKKLIIGSKDGFITFYNMNKKETTSFPVEYQNMRRIVQVVGLPNKIPDVRKCVYYIL